jgi:hypothetical protein
LTSILPVRTRNGIVEDAALSDFHTLPELRHRVPGRPWQVEYVTLPMNALYCPYQNPGDADAPGGFMGGIGWPPDRTERKRIVDLATAIATAVHTGTANHSNVSLNRVLQFVAGGPDFIRSRAQIVAFVQTPAFWFVREGMHRAVALAILGSCELEGINFTTLHQDAP